MILFVPSRLPGLNDLLASKGTVRGSWNRYNEEKSMWYGRVNLLCAVRRIQPQGPGFGTFLFVEPNTKRDPDNVVAGGVKLLLDSLVGAGVLAGDGWRDNLGFAGYWICEPNRAGCLVHWGAELLTKEAMLLLLEKERENGKNGDGPRAFDDGPSRAPATKGARRRRAQPNRKLGRYP